MIRLSPHVSRRMREYLSSGNQGYESLSEFMEIAVLNQLEAELGGGPGPKSYSSRRADAESTAAAPPRLSREGMTDNEVSLLLARPDPSPPRPLVDPVDFPRSTLSPFTNRLSPMKVALRVAATLAKRGDWPELKEFHTRAAAAARAVGLQLRGRESANPHLSVGYPVGDDIQKSSSRFITSFTIYEREGRGVGPLAILRLASVVGGRVVLSRNGWRIAAAPNPLIDGAKDASLSGAEAKVFREAIIASPAEGVAVQHFLHAVAASRGSQEKVDATLSDSSKEWSREMVVAHRAAMVGRLSDAQVLEVSGRGSSAGIHLLPTADEFQQSAHSARLSGVEPEKHIDA
jgi:hypothetical protein